MKKLACVLLSVIMILSFVACGKQEKTATGDVVDIEYYIRLGQMPECEYKLGETVKDLDDGGDENEDEDDFDDFDDDGYDDNETNLDKKAVDGVYYYHVDDDEKEKIVRIVSFNGGFGFANGAGIAEVKNTLSKRDLNAKEETLSEVETFFSPVKSEYIGIKYTFGENTACFVFQNGSLCACTLYNNSGVVY